MASRIPKVFTSENLKAAGEGLMGALGTYGFFHVRATNIKKEKESDETAVRVAELMDNIQKNNEECEEMANNNFCCHPAQLFLRLANYLNQKYSNVHLLLTCRYNFWVFLATYKYILIYINFTINFNIIK